MTYQANCLDSFHIQEHSVFGTSNKYQFVLAGIMPMYFYQFD